MEGRGTYLRVGALLLTGIALLVGLALWIGGSKFGGGARFETYFAESVQGLNIGAPVKYRGVTVGQVADIGVALSEYSGSTATLLSNPDFRQVYVRYNIDLSRLAEVPNVQQAIDAGLRARLATQGLTGLAYVELDFLAHPPPPPPSMPWKSWGTVIPSSPSTLAQVQNTAQALADRLSRLDLEGIVNGITGLTADLRRELQGGDVRDTLQAADALLAEIRQQVAQADLPGTTAALRALAQGPDTRAALAGGALATQRLAAAAEALPRLIAALQATAQRADASSADLTVQLLPILRDTRATLANLREASEGLKRDPGQILFGAPPPRSPEDQK